jgi:hypothetical protein
MKNNRIIKEQFSDEIDLFKMISSYYDKNGIEMTEKVLSKALETIKNRITGHRAPKEKTPPNFNLHEKIKRRY